MTVWGPITQAAGTTTGWVLSADGCADYDGFVFHLENRQEYVCTQLSRPIVFIDSEGVADQPSYAMLMEVHGGHISGSFRSHPL